MPPSPPGARLLYAAMNCSLPSTALKRHDGVVAGLLRRRVAIRRPFGHQPASLLEEVATTIRRLSLVADRMRERHFDNLAREIGALRCPINRDVAASHAPQHFVQNQPNDIWMGYWPRLRSRGYIDLCPPGGSHLGKVFICYVSEDRNLVDRLQRELRSHSFELLIERSVDHPFQFEDYRERIEALVTQADTFVFVISPDAIASEFALRELAMASSLNRRLVPILWRKVDLHAVPGLLRDLKFIPFVDNAHFERSVKELIDALLPSKCGRWDNEATFTELADTSEMFHDHMAKLRGSKNIDEIDAPPAVQHWNQWTRPTNTGQTGMFSSIFFRGLSGTRRALAPLRLRRWSSA